MAIIKNHGHYYPTSVENGPAPYLYHHFTEDETLAQIPYSWNFASSGYFFFTQWTVPSKVRIHIQRWAQHLNTYKKWLAVQICKVAEQWQSCI